jgi:hypothetical protein
MKKAGQTHGWLLLVLLCPLAAPLHGRGGRDGDLDRADSLIVGRQYDAAIRVLAGRAGKSSVEFSRTQGRLRKIMLLRSRYNTLAGELLDLLTNDPDNSEGILDLTRRLEEIEPSRGTTRRFIVHVEELALFGHNRRLLEGIMAEARALLDRGDYAAAMGRYAGGLEISRDAFFAAGHGEPVDSRVRSGLDTLLQGVEDFALLPAAFSDALAGLDRIASGDTLASLRACYARLSPPMERLIGMNNAMTETLQYFDGQMARFLQEDPGLGDRNYLAFASRIIRGRGDQAVQEGLLGAAAGLWASALSPFEAALDRAASLAYRNAVAAQEGGDFSRGREQLELALAHCALAMDYMDDWRRFYRGQDLPTREYFGREVIVFKAEDYLRYHSLELACAGRMESVPLLEERDRLAAADSAALELWQQGRLDTAAALAREARTRDACHDLALRTDAVFKRLSDAAAALSGFRQELTGEGALFAPMENVLALYAGMDGDIFVQENASALREYTIANGDFQRRFTEWKNLFAQGNRLFTGDVWRPEGARKPEDARYPEDARNFDAAAYPQDASSADDGSGSDGSYSAGTHIARYPREALASFERIGRESARDLAEGRDLVARYEKEPPRFFREPRIAALYNSARAMTRELGEIGAAALALEHSARTQAAQAEAFEQEGDRLYGEAQAALARDDFDTARNRALRAGERYDASLAVQESLELRRVRDVTLIGLGAEIARRDHEALVRDLRGLVNTARAVYFEGHFERAEEYLIRAMNRRQGAGLEEDLEIGYWLTVVRGAMGLRAGRVILPTAPLYAEMSQLLSEARKNYNQGTALIAADLREEGFLRFAEARKKTAEVRLLFPVNQEASLLDLRMDQVMDPAAFNASFERRLNEAVSGAARGSVENFAELQNLSQINPGYPGIRGMVDQAEIAMGYRPAPPDPRSLARSAELAAAARGIVDGNLRSQFPAALELLNQALIVDPANSQAMALKDRLQTELGGAGSALLSSAAEREYQRAVQALQQGNTLVAMTIVRHLLSDPRNQQARRVKELQKRIESIL